MKILLVEDDPEISGMLESFLTAENFEVTTAFDGESACGKFIIFSSVMIASFIVGTYKDKTANLMFSYPISRKLILGAQILADSAVMISISFVALPVGMLLKSSKAAIIAGVVIVCFTQGNIGSYTLMGNIPFYTVLMAISAVSVFLALYRVEMRDV